MILHLAENIPGVRGLAPACMTSCVISCANA